VEILKYMLLGLIQGLTEFLPVSSSGHLVLAEHWLGINPPGVVLEVSVHLATLASVVVVYRRDLLALLKESRWHYIGLLLAGTAVTVAVVLPLRGYLEWLTESTGAVRMVGGMLLVTATWLILADRRLRQKCEKQQPSWWGAVLIGLAQAAAALPGISRSGATIGEGILLGMERQAAARFSFLLSIPVIAGASVLVLPDIPAAAAGGLNIAGLVAAFITAMVSGIAAIYIVLWALKRASLFWFALYCACLGSIALSLGG
jgi:undecaprenyl-diphosphatase